MATAGTLGRSFSGFYVVTDGGFVSEDADGEYGSTRLLSEARRFASVGQALTAIVLTGGSLIRLRYRGARLSEDGALVLDLSAEFVDVEAYL